MPRSPKDEVARKRRKVVVDPVPPKFHRPLCAVPLDYLRWMAREVLVWRESRQ